MISICYFLSCIFGYFLMAIRRQDYYDPNAIMLFFWLLASSLASYEGLYNTQLQQSLSLESHLSIFIVAVTLFLPIFLPNKNIKVNVVKIVEFNPSMHFRWFFNLLMVLSIFAFFLRFKSIIFSPPILGVELTDLKHQVPDGIPFIHYFDLLTPFLAITAFFEIIFSRLLSKCRRIVLISYIFFAVVVAVAYKVSRGELLVIALGVLYLLHVRYKISFVKFFALIISILTLIVVFTSLRLSGTGLASNYLNGGLSIFSPFYTYIALNFENYNKLTTDIFVQHSVYIASLKFMIYPFYPEIYSESSGYIVNHETLFFNAKPFIYYFYHDLGLFGVFFYSLLVSVSVYFVNSLTKGDIRYCLLVAFMQKALFFLFFGNYFFGELVMVFPYVICVFLILISYRRIKVF